MVNARQAVGRARAVARDNAFKREMDEEALRALFPSNYPLNAN
jgi:GST-like protein